MAEEGPPYSIILDRFAKLKVYDHPFDFEKAITTDGQGYLDALAKRIPQFSQGFMKGGDENIFSNNENPGIQLKRKLFHYNQQLAVTSDSLYQLVLAILEFGKVLEEESRTRLNANSISLMLGWFKPEDFESYALPIVQELSIKLCVTGFIKNVSSSSNDYTVTLSGNNPEVTLNEVINQIKGNK